MFFGLTNSLATFQSMMDNIFGDLIRSDKIIVYLDDILIFSDDLEEHYNTTMEVLRRLRKHKLMLKAEKCKFDQTTIDFLGVVVGKDRSQWTQRRQRQYLLWRLHRMSLHELMSATLEGSREKRESLLKCLSS